MRLKSKKTTIEYAGRVLVGPGDYFDGESISGERTYTTTGVSLVMSASPSIENYGNASGSQTFSTSRDFDDFEALMRYLLDVTSFADNNPKGDLLISVGDAGKAYDAGLVSLNYEITLVASCRLLLTWEFLLK